jgi:AsmA protein
MKILKIVGIVVAVLVLILIALPFLINVNSFRPKIESELTTALGRQVTVGNLSLSLLSGSVEAENIAIADDPKFSKSPFVTAKSLKVGVEMMPLIFSKQLNITGITLQDPQITLLKTPAGTWNFSSLGGANKQAATPDKSSAGAAQNISVAQLSIANGKLIVGKANSTAKPTVYDKVNIDVSNFSTTSQFPFKLTASLPGSGDVNITGKAGPISTDDVSKTPFDAAVKVNNMNIGASGFVDAATGINGLANFDGTLTSTGSEAKAVGLFTGSKMVFSPKGTPAPKNITIKHTVNVDLDKQVMTIAQGDVGIGSAQAHLTGTVASQGETQVANLKLNAPGMSVDELESMLPSFGVILPSGSQLKGGTLSTELAIAGPVNALVITGPVKLASTKLAGFDLGSKLGSLSAFAGKAVSNPDTSIQNFSLDARQSNAGTQANNINLTVPAIGVITGAGTVSPAGALAFKMLANLHGGMAGGLTEVAALGSGKGGIPFAIEGTTSNPKFIPDMKGIVGGVAQGALGQLTGAGASKAVPPGAVNALGGLLGKKK